MRKFEGLVRVVFNSRKGAVALAKGDGKGYDPADTVAIVAAIGRAMDAEKAPVSRWACYMPGLDRKTPTADITAAEFKRGLAMPDVSPVVMADRFGNPVLAVFSDTRKARVSVLKDY